jgi:hypothetical protein
MTHLPTPFKWIDPSTLPTRAEELSSGLALGFRGADGRFEPDRHGQRWIAFDEPDDVVYWNPKTGFIATYYGHAFALGELNIKNAATYALGDSLKIFGTVAQWIDARGRGIFVIEWPQAFDKLRDAVRIEVDDRVSAEYRRHIQPRLPVVNVRRQQRSAAT